MESRCPSAGGFGAAGRSPLVGCASPLIVFSFIIQLALMTLAVALMLMHGP